MALICPQCTKNNNDNALHCKHCGAGLMGAVHVPNPSIFQPRNVALVALVVLGIAGATGNLGALFPPRTASDPTAFSADIAYNRCQEAIKAQLVAPSTAQFPPFGEVFRVSEDGTHHFVGTVESSNRLGVPLVGEFVCDVEESQSGVFTVVNVEVTE